MENQELKHKLKNDGYAYIKVQGGSMRPWIKSGSVVKVNAIDTGRIKRGDIVLYQVEEQFLVHRVIKILVPASSKQGNKSEKIFVIAGDNRIDTIIHKIKEEQIVGIVNCSCRFIGKSRIKRILELFLVMPIHYIYIIARFICLNKKSNSPLVPL
ncbi:MAG: signal peptidase I [Candidatus Firestonebacteria bacterium]